MSLKKNVLNLFIVQIVSYVVPLLQLPYLSRVLGQDIFGIYVFCYSIIIFCFVITNYGFETYLPQKIASEKIEGEKLNIIFTQTLLIRFGLLVFNILLLFLFYIFNRHLSERLDLIFAIALCVFGNAFSFLWLYQSKEMIYIYSRISVFSKIFSILLVYLFVKSDEDIFFALFYLGVGNLLSVIFSYFIAARKFNIKIEKTNFHDTLGLAKSAFEFFISRLFVAFYAVAGGMILGSFSDSLGEVAIYGAAHQLYAAGVYAMSALSTPLLPYMARTKNYKVFFKITAAALALTLLGSAVGIFFGDFIITLVFGEGLIAAKPVLDVFMVTIFFSVLGIHFGYPALQPLNKVRAANMSVIAAGCVQAVLISLMVIFKLPMTAVYIAIIYLFCDVCMSLYRIGIFFKNWKFSFSS